MILDGIGNFLIIVGSLFFVLAGIGLVRMPDVFNRIQAGTKATTLGAFSVILGVGLLNPAWLPKSLLLIVLVAVTNPVGSSVLAKAAYVRKDPLHIDTIGEMHFYDEEGTE